MLVPTLQRTEAGCGPHALEETGSGCMKGVSGPPSSAHLMEGGMWLSKQSLCCHGHGVCCTLKECCLSVCPPSLGWQRLWRGKFVMLGHPRPAGSHSDPYGLQGLLRDGLGGDQVPPSMHLTMTLPCQWG